MRRRIRGVIGAGLVTGLLAGLSGMVLPLPASAGPGTPITACSITTNNSVLYERVADGPVSATFSIDTSTSLLKPATYYVWIVGSGSSGIRYRFAIEQTGPSSAPFVDSVLQQSHSQLLNNATGGTFLQTAEAYKVDVVVTSGTSFSPMCQVEVTLAPNIAPSAPTAVTATAGNGEATVSWTPWKSFTGQSYTVTASPGGQTCTATHPATSCTVSGLTNGTAYTFSVTNKTSGGTSAASTASSSVTPSAPATTTTVAAPTTTVAGSGGSGAGNGAGDGGADDGGIATTADGGTLPDTGVDFSVMVAGLLTLLASGGALVAIGRRRRLIG